MVAENVVIREMKRTPCFFYVFTQCLDAINGGNCANSINGVNVINGANGANGINGINGANGGNYCFHVISSPANSPQTSPSLV